MKRMKPGDLLPVKDSYHYELPPGLKAGSVVKLVSFSAGFWTVEADGRQFQVFLGLVDPGWEYEIGNRWLSAEDPGVMARRAEENLSKSPAFSCANGGCLNPPIH